MTQSVYSMSAQDSLSSPSAETSLQAKEASHPQWSVRESLPIHYDIHKNSHLFALDNTSLLQYGWDYGRRFIIIDSKVDAHYGETIRAWFSHHKIEAKFAVIKGGEAHKTSDIFLELLKALDEFPIHRRNEPIIAIGGGVVTDIAGFVAGVHRRGVPHIKIPTTLMGYVDASIGIKVGVNFNTHKNRIGGFEPPLAVFLDKTFLQTLSRRHLLNGWCEIIKLGVICDKKLFNYLEAYSLISLKAGFLNESSDLILDRAIECMLRELSPNLFETKLERPVDFGHTFSYGLEMAFEETLLHGEAVLLDILISVLIAKERGFLTEEEVDRVFSLVNELAIGLDLEAMDAKVMWQSLQERITHRDGKQRVPLPQGLGQSVFANDITYSEIETATQLIHHYLRA